MTKIKAKESINWQTFIRRILIHCAVGTTAVCKERRNSNKHKGPVKGLGSLTNNFCPDNMEFFFTKSLKYYNTK